MSGIVDGLGSRSGVVGTTVNAKIPKGESPGGIDSYTVCMVRSDGTNNQAATFNPDISIRSKIHTYGANGDPKHDTMAAPSLPPLTHSDGRAYSSCIAFDGNDSIQFGGSDHRHDFSFMRGDFTIDFWVRLAGVAGDQYMFSFSGGGSSDGHFAYNVYGSNFRIGPMSNSAHGYIGCAHGMSTNTWYHLAYARHKNNTFAFRDGVIIGTGTVSTHTDFMCDGNVYWGGYTGGGAQITGQMAEMRVSKGIARWTTTFPKPSKAYF